MKRVRIAAVRLEQHSRTYAWFRPHASSAPAGQRNRPSLWIRPYHPLWRRNTTAADRPPTGTNSTCGAPSVRIGRRLQVSCLGVIPVRLRYDM